MNHFNSISVTIIVVVIAEEFHCVYHLHSIICPHPPNYMLITSAVVIGINSVI